MRALVSMVLGLLVALPLRAAEPEAYILSRRQAEEQVAGALVGQGAGNRVKVSIPGGQSPKLFEASQPFDTEVTGLTFDGRSQRFTATLRFLDDTGKAIATRDVGGRYVEIEKVPVLKRRLGAGEIIGAADIGWAEVEQTRLRDDTVTSEEQLIGQSPRRTVTADRPIRLSELERPAVITRNQAVTLMFSKNGVEIKTEGKALQDGGIGEVISVENSKSGVVVRGRVISGNTVDVTPGMPQPSRIGANSASQTSTFQNDHDASPEAGSQ